ELTLDRGLDDSELAGDLGIRMPFHLAHGDESKRLVGQRTDQPFALLGSLYGQFWVRLLAQQEPQIVGLEIGERTDLAPAAPGGLLLVRRGSRFPQGDDGKEPPQVLAVVELGESAFFSPATDAVKGAECDVFFVGDTADGVAQTLAGQTGQSPSISS